VTDIVSDVPRPPVPLIVASTVAPVISSPLIPPPPARQRTHAVTDVPSSLPTLRSCSDTVKVSALTDEATKFAEVVSGSVFVSSTTASSLRCGLASHPTRVRVASGLSSVETGMALAYGRIATTEEAPTQVT
jgi:hypothetical protein